MRVREVKLRGVVGLLMWVVGIALAQRFFSQWGLEDYVYPAAFGWIYAKGEANHG